MYVFIDAANILYSQQTLGWRVDYAKLKAYIEKECDLKGIFFYTGHVGDNAKQQSFLQKLRALGYHIHSKEVKRIRTGRHTYLWKGNLDVELSIDAVLSLSEYETLILLSGDSDFAYLLDVVKQRGRRVIVMSQRGHVSRELLERAKFIDLRRLRDEIQYTKSPPPKRGEV